MVDRSRKVNVDASLKEREWKTEEFNAVLNQHTEQVNKGAEPLGEGRGGGTLPRFE
jgi:hypothetical protein